MEINRPDIVREVTDAFQRYEQALNDNDVDVLNELFWNDPLTLRLGIAEMLYGHDAIAAFRGARPVDGVARTLRHTIITTFGDEFATANTEYTRPGSPLIGRQSHSWVRFAEGWRIVAAHVSRIEDPEK
jgi:hypothetical protein